MKLVKFKDGSFGVRHWSLFDGYRFADLSTEHDFWWKVGSRHFGDCKSTEERAREVLNIKLDIGEVVK